MAELTCVDHYDVRYSIEDLKGSARILDPEGRITNSIEVERFGVCAILTRFEGFTLEDLKPMELLTDKLLRPSDRGGAGFMVLRATLQDGEITDVLQGVGFLQGSNDRSHLYLSSVSRGV